MPRAWAGIDKIEQILRDGMAGGGKRHYYASCLFVGMPDATAVLSEEESRLKLIPDSITHG